MSDDIIKLWLPWPPSLNHGYKIYKGRKVLSQETKKYKLDIGWEAKKFKNKKLYTEQLNFVCYLFPPDNRKRDDDNYVKFLRDGLQGILYDDDNQIMHTDIYKGCKIFLGRVYIEISRFTADMRYFEIEREALKVFCN